MYLTWFKFSLICWTLNGGVDTRQRVPEGLDDVGGDGGSALVGVGLPGEGDGVLGHLRHDRLLRRPRQLNELGDSGHWRDSALCYTHKRTVHTLSCATTMGCAVVLALGFFFFFTLSWVKGEGVKSAKCNRKSVRQRWEAPLTVSTPLQLDSPVALVTTHVYVPESASCQTTVDTQDRPMEFIQLF